MNIPTLVAASPTEINAVYDKFWVSEVIISSEQIGGQVTARVKLTKFRDTADGVEKSPGAETWLTVNDLMEAADGDQDLAAAVGAIVAAIQKVGRQEGEIA